MRRLLLSTREFSYTLDLHSNPARQKCSALDIVADSYRNIIFGRFSNSELAWYRPVTMRQQNIAAKQT